MRIAVFFPNCHRRGGIERIVLETANYLAARGHEVHLGACRWDKTSLDNRVIVHPIAPGRGPAPLPAIAFARRSRLAARDIHADVTAAFGVYCPPGAVFWAGSVHRAWIQTSQSQRNWWGRLRQRLNPFHPVMLAFERYYLGRRHYKKLIAYTPRVKDEFIHYYSVPESDIAVIPCGYSPTEFNLDRRETLRGPARAKLGFAPQDKVIVFVANELHRKGFATLLRAWATILQPNERLLVVGRASPAPFLAEIHALGLANRVHFAGSADDVAQFYSAADIFALPTQYEPWGLVIVEALACGLPVLTSRIAGAASAVIDAQTGLLLDEPTDICEVAKKLRRLLDGEHADTATIASSVAHLTWPSVLGRFEQVLIECAAPSARGLSPSPCTQGEGRGEGFSNHQNVNPSPTIPT
ncbi:MAG: glycosyltransferase family 4 protein [Tepidisphaeraceae bacterium]